MRVAYPHTQNPHTNTLPHNETHAHTRMHTQTHTHAHMHTIHTRANTHKIARRYAYRRDLLKEPSWLLLLGVFYRE